MKTKELYDQYLITSMVAGFEPVEVASASGCVMRAVDGKEASFAKETIDKPDVTVTSTTDVISGVMDKKINPMTAYMQRKIQVKGAMDELLRLQKIIM